jgi:SlyX protein
MESRISELEAKLSLAEDLLDALNRTVYRQQQQIDELRREMRELREQVRNAGPDASALADDNVPPHY